MMMMMLSLRMLLCLWAVTMMIHVSSADLAKDEAECTDKLLGLSTCLTYVQEGSRSTAKAPTPDCCSGLKGVIEKSTRCLCILIKDHDDPALGLSINVTRALTLPTSCHAAVNLTQCPEMLNLPPGSKDAQVFYQYAKEIGNSTATTKGASSSSATAATTASPGKGSTSSSNNKGDVSGAAAGKKKWLGATGSVWVAAPLFAVVSLILCK